MLHELFLLRWPGMWPSLHVADSRSRTGRVVCPAGRSSTGTGKRREPLGLPGCGRRRSAQDVAGGLDHSTVENRGADVLEVHFSAERPEQ